MIVLTAVAAAGALLLVWAGVDHLGTLWTPGAAAGQPFGRRQLAGSLGAAEIAVGAAVLAALAFRLPAGRWALAAQAVLYAGFLGQLAIRYRRHDRADCGCARLGARIGRAGLARAGALAAITAVAAAGYPAVALPADTPADSRLALWLASSVVLCLLLHALPPAVDGLAARAALTQRRRYG